MRESKNATENLLLNNFSSSDFDRPPKKGRFFRRFLLLSFFSTGVVFGGLYFSKDARDFVIWKLPDSKPVLEQIESYIGGWYSSKVAVAPSQEFSLPFVKKPQPVKESTEEVKIEQTTPHSEPVYPTYEDVMQMHEEKAHCLPATDKSIEDAVGNAGILVGKARESLNRLEDATRAYIEGLREAMQAAVDTNTKDRRWQAVAKLVRHKESAQDRADCCVEDANKALDVLRSALEQTRDSHGHVIQSDVVRDGILALGNLKYSLGGSICETRKLQNELEMVMRYRDLVSQSHASLQAEIQSLYEYLGKLGDTSSTGEELIKLFMAARDKVSHLQMKLAESEDREKQRLHSALESQRRADEAIIPEFVARSIELERSRCDLDRYNQSIDADKLKQRDLQEAAVRHSENLSRMLRVKDEEKEQDFALRIREKLTQERQAFEAALTGWTERMRAIEEVVDGRADLDRIAKESQALWIACEAFISGLRSAKPMLSDGFSSPDHTGPLYATVEAVTDAASTGDHPFALTLLRSLPDYVVRDGIWMETGLKRRFEKIYTTCKRVALVDETGGSLWTYTLSYLNSLLQFDSFNIVSRPTDKSDTNEPDTLSLLRSAKAALALESTQGSEQIDGDQTSAIINQDDGIEIAVRLLGQLRGQARIVAADWLADARVYLETKQIAQALLTYAAARGISTYQKRL